VSRKQNPEGKSPLHQRLTLVGHPLEPKWRQVVEFPDSGSPKPKQAQIQESKEHQYDHTMCGKEFEGERCTVRGKINHSIHQAANQFLMQSIHPFNTQSIKTGSISRPIDHLLRSAVEIIR